MVDSSAMTLSVEAGNNGIEPIVVVRFGSKGGTRTFTAAKWTELDAAVRELWPQK